MRKEFRDGQWAEYRDRITHATDKQIRRDRAAAFQTDDTKWNWPDVLIRVYVTAWSVNDLDGRPIALADPDAIDRAPEDVIDDLFEAVAGQWLRTTVPNAPTPPSSDS